jgi:hypothetical protein
LGSANWSIAPVRDGTSLLPLTALPGQTLKRYRGLPEDGFRALCNKSRKSIGDRAVPGQTLRRHGGTHTTREGGFDSCLSLGGGSKGNWRRMLEMGGSGCAGRSPTCSPTRTKSQTPAETWHTWHGCLSSRVSGRLWLPGLNKVASIFYLGVWDQPAHMPPSGGA